MSMYIGIYLLICTKFLKDPETITGIKTVD